MTTEQRAKEAADASSSTPVAVINRVLSHLQDFYGSNPHIQSSHGLSHALAVHGHAVNALACLSPPLPVAEAMEIEVASLLHDVDDRKYFPATTTTDDNNDDADSTALPNARKLCADAGIDNSSVERICLMISWVSCSTNGNDVPHEVSPSGSYQWLIPRWSDRLEAVGAVGVVRCYQYSKEHNRPLCSDDSPRATSVEEVLAIASPHRFEAYRTSGGKSEDMISHYYDKLLHVARPPASIVRNSYLEEKAKESSKELIEVCVSFGRTGRVDEDYIRGLGRMLTGMRVGHNGHAAAAAIAANTDSSILGRLPPGLLPAILSDYCDTHTLSSFLTAHSSKRQGRHLAIETVASAVRMRIDDLGSSNRIPASLDNKTTGKNVRWNRQSIDIAGHLRNFCAHDDEHKVDDGDDGRNSERWNDILRRIQRLARTFPALCFFEDEMGLCLRTTLESSQQQQEQNDDGGDDLATERFELPLWTGRLPLSQVMDVAVVVTAPFASWSPIQIAEWGNLNSTYGTSPHDSHCGRALKSRPRRATPFPPLARISALSNSDNERLRGLSHHLFVMDQVIELDVPKGCTMMIMSKCQAFQRLSSDPIGRRYMTKKTTRERFLSEAWSLGYRRAATDRLQTSPLPGPPGASVLDRSLPVARGKVEGRTFENLLTDPDYLEMMCRDKASSFDDLFVFMEPTDESNDDAGEATVVDMVHHMTVLFDRYAKLVALLGCQR